MNILYILMRTDMLSMNPGKGMAQASHATSLFHQSMSGSGEDNLWWYDENEAKYRYDTWRSEANGFGTVLVLGVTESQMKDLMNSLPGRIPYGMVLDPTYPLRDGYATHYFPVYTCAWVFGDKEALAPYLSHLELHP